MTPSSKTPTSARSSASRRHSFSKLAMPVLAIGAVALLAMSETASASIVPTVSLATAANYSVLAGSTVTNTGSSVLAQSVGLFSGTSVTGFPPGIVTPPATIEATTGAAQLAKDDLTAAYVDAAGRPVEMQTTADLVGLTLFPGVYAASSKGPLSLSGQLVLDGQGNGSAVFIFQTDSTLTTGSASTIELINGASECNVFWQIGSSATLGSGSVFVGNILALTSVTVNTGVVVHGRALARNGAVTLDSDVFTAPSCTPSTATAAPTTSTTAPATTVPVDTVPVVTVPAVVAAPTTVPSFLGTDITLPRTGGRSVGSTSTYGVAALVVGFVAIAVARRRSAA